MLDYFSLKISSNYSCYIAPGKQRSLSSISPVIVFNKEGEVELVTGCAGGSKIITGTVLSLINTLDWGMTLTENLAVPRIHDMLTRKTYYEQGFDVKWVEELRRMGYNMTQWSGRFPMG